MADIYCCHFEYGGTDSSTYGLHFVNVNTDRFINIQGQLSGVNIMNKRNKRNYLIDDDYSGFPVSYDIDIVTDDERVLMQSECRAIENWLFNRRYNMKLYINPDDDPDMYTYDKYQIVTSYPSTGVVGVTYMKVNGSVYETKTWNGSSYVAGNNMKFTTNPAEVQETISGTVTKYYPYTRPSLNTLYVHRLYLNCRFLNPEKLEYNGGIVGYKATLVADGGVWLQDYERVSYSLSGTSSTINLQIDTDQDVYTYPKVSMTSDGAAFSGTSTSTLGFVAATSSPSKRYRCVVTDGNGGVTMSSAVTVNVYSGSVPHIVSEPSNTTAKEGQTVTFSVRALGEDLSYQWQRQPQTSNPSTGVWTDCTTPGFDSQDFTFTMSSTYDDRRYRCRVTGYNGTSSYAEVYTSNFTLDLDEGTSPAINRQPSSVEVFAGERASFSVDASGGGDDGTSLQYQWQVSKNNGSTWANCVSDGNTNSVFGFTTKAGYNGWKYRCKVSNVVGGVTQETISNVCTLTVNDGSTPIIADQPDSTVTVLSGTLVELPIVAYGKDLTYKWQVSTNSGSSWSDCQSGDVTITNYTDDPLRPTGLIDVPGNTTIVLNGETNYVKDGYYYLFNTRHFPRILPFVSNTFTITGPLNNITFEYVNRRNL